MSRGFVRFWRPHIGSKIRDTRILRAFKDVIKIEIDMR